ncbi:hypothetical protein [Cerasicoccus frondis]|uniref:hypothetical protein n=1 Tax=Cerasicoccus frondis TaxID=490090 RepID=UPI002852492E|nr:hypothetical protein [Cerasicoccus frondis]
MKFRPYLIAFGLCFLMFIAGFVIWATHDDEPLDYSSMDIEIGPKDASINGYTRLQEIGDSLEFDLGVLDDYYSDEYYDYSPFAAPMETLNIQEIREIVAANLENIRAVDEAFTLEQFYVDDEPNVDTIIPSVGDLQDYTKVRTMEARLLAIDGDPDAALARLLNLDEQLTRFAQGGGGLVHLLTATACIGISNHEMLYLISHYDLSEQALRDAIKTYPLRNVLSDELATAIKWEFHFALNTLSLIQEEPEGLGMLDDNLGRIPPQLIKLVCKPNKTRNSFYQLYSGMLDDQNKPFADRKTVNPQKPSLFRSILRGNVVGEMLPLLLIPATDRVTQSLAQQDAYSAYIYLLFALRLYQLEHGSLPPTLDALTPDIILNIPLDPYDGQPLRYNAERGIVYAVGIDGVDDGGNAYLSSFDYAHPDYEDAHIDDEIAHVDKNEPTFHIRFDLEPRTFERAE